MRRTCLPTSFHTAAGKPAVGGYVTTAVCASAIGLATTATQVGVLRAVAWGARGLRVPARYALLADLVPASAYGRAYGSAAFAAGFAGFAFAGSSILLLGLPFVLGSVGPRSLP